METAIVTASVNAMALPAPRRAVSVRLATNDDIAFMDEYQKLHNKQLGFMPKQTFEGKIKAGHVLVAEAACGVADQPVRDAASGGERVGYVISQDKYMGHEDVGIFYQVNVKPVAHRSLIGATLVKEVFERAAYGCKLFCCWCAQDIQANYFWESLGFVPLAFRSGNRAKSRIHIFWQKRIREGDTTTPYWFPSETKGGMMNEARLVLPIPPGTSWQDAKPIILPGGEDRQLEAPKQKRVREKRVPLVPQVPTARLRQFGPPGAKPIVQETKVQEKPKREKRPKQKNDPRLIAMARELRDRYLESVESGKYLPPVGCGKYEVTRQLIATARAVEEPKLLAA